MDARAGEPHGRTVSVNFSQFDQAPDLWREVLDKLDEAIADGIPIVAQVHGRTVGLLMCLEGSYHPLMFHPAYARDRASSRSPNGVRRCAPGRSASG